MKKGLQYFCLFLPNHNLFLSIVLNKKSGITNFWCSSFGFSESLHPAHQLEWLKSLNISEVNRACRCPIYFFFFSLKKLLQWSLNIGLIFTIQDLTRDVSGFSGTTNKAGHNTLIAIPNNKLQCFPTSLLFLDEVISVTLYPDVPL